MDLYERIFEHTPDALIVVAADGKIHAANPRTEPMFGYKPEELIGQLVDVLVPDSVAGSHAAHRARYMTEPHTRPWAVRKCA